MVLVPGKKDLEFFSQVNREVHNLFFPEIPYYPLVTPRDKVDDLYYEARDDIFGDPTLLPAFVDYTVERRRLLTLFGKDEQRDLIIWCSTKVMEEHDIAPKSGDIFIVDNKEYQVMDESLRSHVMNQNIYLERGFSTKMWRGSSIADERIDDSVPEPNIDEELLGESPMLFDPQYPEE